MIKINFHGALQKEFDIFELDADVKNCKEVLMLLEANRRGTLNKWFRRGLYRVLVNGKDITKITAKRKFKHGDVVDLVPVVAGSGLFTIIAIVVAVIALVVAVLSIFTKPKIDASSEDSNSISAETNVSKEGVMLPVVYGQARVKPIIISSDRVAGISNSVTPERPRIPWYLEDDVALGTASNGAHPSQTYLKSEDVTVNALYAVSEGPVESVLANGRKSIFLDDTQLEADDNSQNVDDVKDFTRSGTYPQSLLSLFQNASSPVTINEELTEDFLVRTLTADLDAVRINLVTGGLFKKQKKKELAVKIRVLVDIAPTGTGSWSRAANILIEEKTFEEKIFQFTVELDNSIQYDIRLRRGQPAVTSSNQQESLSIDSFTEITNGRVSYDGTALLGLSTLNPKFSKVETLTKGRIVRVPSNYNPTTRAYTGIWDGTFKDAWTDNLYYVALDVVENSVYGLGGYSVPYDKFEIYALGQYADAQVSDGKGGTEPRFTFNGAIYDRQKAIKQLNELLSVGRSQYIWDGGQLSFYAEQGGSPIKIATNANVQRGSFTYNGKALEAQKNSCTVKYRDPDNAFLPTTINYRDHDGIRRNGLNEIEIDATEGVASPGLAMRIARYSVLTDSLIVNFNGGEEFNDTLPGDIIEIYDQDWAGERLGGLILSATATQLQLDQQYTAVGGDEIAVHLPDGSREQRTISSAVGNIITVSSPFSATPQVHAVWGIENSTLSSQKFIVQSVERSDQYYAISATSYDPTKLAFVEDGYTIENNEDTVKKNIFYVGRPLNITTQEVYRQQPGYLARDIEITWDEPSSNSEVIGYDVYFQVDGQGQRTLETGSRDTRAVIPNVLAARYDVWVYARTSSAISSPALATFNVEDQPTINPTKIVALQLFGQGNNPEFANRDAKFTWTSTSPIQEDDGFADGTVFQDFYFKDFIVQILDGEDVVREEEGISLPEYTYTLEKNVEDQERLNGVGSDPLRSFTIRVYYRDQFNRLSDPSSLTVNNPAPPVPNNIVVTGTVGGITVSYDQPLTLLDYAGCLIHVSDTNGFTPDETNLVSDENSTNFYFDVPAGSTRYVKLAVYDSFGKSGLNYSSQFTAVTKDKIDDVAPATPTGLFLSSSVVNDDNKTQSIRLDVTCDRSTESDFSFYEFAVKEDVGNFVEMTSPQVDVGLTPTMTLYNIRPNTLYTVKVRGFDTSGNRSAYSSEVSITSASDSTIPNAPTGFIASAAFKNIFLEWVQDTATDLDFTRIYVNDVNVFGSASVLAEIRGSGFVHSGLGTGATKYYWLTSVDTSDNESPETASVTATTGSVETADYANLSIVNAAIDNLAVDNAKIADVSADKLIANTIMSNTILVDGTSLGSTTSRAADPATRINAGSTEILPGLVTISGSTTLGDWRKGGDLTRLDGGAISANTVSANRMEIGSRNLAIDDIDFETNNSANQLSWTAGTITYTNDAGSAVSSAISAGNVTWTSGTIYVYWTNGGSALSTSTSQSTAMTSNTVVLATYKGGSNLLVTTGRTVIDGDYIKTGTITAASGIIDSINADVITTGTLNADRVQIDNVTLDTSGGQLIVKTAGVSTNQLAANAVIKLEDSFIAGPVTVVNVAPAATTLITTNIVKDISNSKIKITASFLYEGSGSLFTSRFFIYRDAAQLADWVPWSAVVNDATMSLTIIDDLIGTGSRDYKILGYKTNGSAVVRAEQIALIVEEIKR